MTDLGNLGGTNSGAQCINNRGQVIGLSTLPGDLVTHAFLWQNGRMQDLGTLGGPLSEAFWINDSGDIAGSADLPTPGLHDAVIWKHGRIHDLGTVAGDPCSRAYGINSRGQVVGGSSSCHAFLHAFVWQKGGPMMDLNALIQPGTGYQLTNAIDINDRGEILAKAAPLGFTPNDDAGLGHLALLIPCDDDHSGMDGCDYSAVDPGSVVASVNALPPTAIRNSGDEDRPAFPGGPKAMLKRVH
jgi:probable HAF family extracellular repeat protein